MTRVTAAGMVADRIAERALQTSSDVIAGIVTATSIVEIVDRAIMISNTTDGVAGDRHSLLPQNKIYSYGDSLPHK
jgi:hypothetical protein